MNNLKGFGSIFGSSYGSRIGSLLSLGDLPGGSLVVLPVVLLGDDMHGSSRDESLVIPLGTGMPGGLLGVLLVALLNNDMRGSSLPGCLRITRSGKNLEARAGKPRNRASSPSSGLP